MSRMQFISWKDICLSGGFWKKWQETAADITSRVIYDRFLETGRIDAMKLEWKEGMPNKPHVFWDSDIAKWMEGCAYFLYHTEDKDVRAKLESMIDRIAEGQTEDGYFNSAILTLEPEKRFTDRTNHELYTAGHLIEAAVAHYESTGSTRFLERMEQFANGIERVFVTEKSAGYKTPGHQELELALVRLYHTTGKRRYLELARHFVDTRGTDPKERIFSVPNGVFPAKPPLDNQLFYNDTYAQDNVPARELKHAGGHAVRALYYYSAMADMAEAYGDEGLFEACRQLWEDSVNRKMYVTGGVSGERYGEAIGAEYVLPNDLSYAETCASVAMANFSMRMFKMEQNGRYADMIERQMYNGALAGLSMDGKAFFYDNAMQCRTNVTDFYGGIHAKPLYPPYRRQQIFECSCCPPNIYRFLGALGQYFYSVEEETIFIHQYAQSSASICVGGKQFKIIQETSYPWNGKVKIILEPEETMQAVAAVRIPGWSRNVRVNVNGMTVLPKIEKGYWYLERIWEKGDVVELDIPMPVILLEGHPGIAETARKVAITRGPLVYCVEAADQEGINLLDLTLEQGTDFTREEKYIEDHAVTVLKANALVNRMERWNDILYQPYSPEYDEVQLTAVPYFAWANRQAGDMAVWLKVL